MKLQEAIKDLRARVDGEFFIKGIDDCEDMKLGIEALKEIKWTSDTAKTWLVSEYKVSPEGTLEDVIKRLTRDQAEEFIREIQDRADKKQLELFE